MRNYQITRNRFLSFVTFFLFTLAVSSTAHAQNGNLGHDVNGKYHELVDQFGCAGDESQYGNFHDYGWWPGGMYCGSVRAAGYYVWYNGTWAVWASSSGHLGDGGQGDPGPDPGHDVNGKYWDLVDQFGCPADEAQYGNFHDYGWWPGGMYCGSDRPAGYYVWYNGTWAVWSTAVR